MITGLNINGAPIVVTGAPNQTINLLLAKIVINERTTKISGNSGSIHTAALHITAAGLVDVSLGVADAGITCAAGPTVPRRLPRSVRRTPAAGSSARLAPTATAARRTPIARAASARTTPA